MVKKDSPLISVIVPVYGIESYIDECIRSIVKQTYRNLEIILVDDKTPDNSGQICDAWSKKDARITVVHKQQNGGLNMARYTGWNLSSGDYIAFIDGDDVVDKRYIETLFSCLQGTGSDISAVGYRFFQHNEKPVFDQNEDCSHKIFSRAQILKHHATQQRYISDYHGNLTTVHCKLFKRSIIEGVEWEKSNYSIGEDDFFSLMCYANCKKVALVYIELYFYRISPNSISRSRGLNVKYNDKKISIFTLVRNYKVLSSELLGKDFVDEVNYRTYVLYLYYINLLITKNAWTDSDFAVLQDNIKNDAADILKIKKYQIERELFEKVVQNGAVQFFAKIIREKDNEMNRLDKEISRLRNELIDLDTGINNLRSELESHLGVKRSAKLFMGNIKRRIVR